MEKLATYSMQPIDNSHKLHACIFHSIIWIMEEKFRKERSKLSLVVHSGYEREGGSYIRRKSR